MADPKEELSRLDESIRRMKVEFDRFFNGALPIPPDDLRREIQYELRRLRSVRLPHLEDRFVLSGLEARFNSLSELFNRRLRDQELGGAPSEPDGLDPYSGVVFGGGDAREPAMALYHEIYGIDGRRKKTDFATFLQFLEKKAAKIREVTGCGEVQFRVIQAEGGLSLKAKPLRPSSG